MMMATQFDSFDASPQGAFIESPMGARNRVREPIPTDPEFIVVVHAPDATVYHPFTWARQQTTFAEGPFGALAEGADRARASYAGDLQFFGPALEQLKTLGRVALILIHTADRYDMANHVWNGDPATGFVEIGHTRATASFARGAMLPPGISMPPAIIRVDYDNVEGWTANDFGRTVAGALGLQSSGEFVPSVVDFEVLGNDIGPNNIAINVVNHIFDETGQYMTGQEHGDNFTLPRSIGWGGDVAWTDGLGDRFRHESHAHLSPAWFVLMIGAMQRMYQRNR